MARKKGTQAEATEATASEVAAEAQPAPFEGEGLVAFIDALTEPVSNAPETPAQEGATRVLTRYADHQNALRQVYAERATSEGGPTGIACPNCERKKAENRGEGEVGELVADGAVLPNRYPPERHVTCSYCGARDTVIV